MSIKTWVPKHPPFEAAEYFLQEHVEQPGSSDEFPFETYDGAYEFCLGKIIAEMKELERQKGQGEVDWIAGSGGYYWGCIWGSWGGDYVELYNVWTPENQAYSINNKSGGRRSRRKRRKPKVFTYDGKRGHLDAYDKGGTQVNNEDSDSDDENIPDTFAMKITLRKKREEENIIPEYLLDAVYECGELLFDTDGVWSENEDQQKERCEQGNEESDPEDSESDPEDSESDPEDSESDAEESKECFSIEDLQRKQRKIKKLEELYVILKERLELYEDLLKISKKIQTLFNRRLQASETRIRQGERGSKENPYENKEVATRILNTSLSELWRELTPKEKATKTLLGYVYAIKNGSPEKLWTFAIKNEARVELISDSTIDWKNFSIKIRGRRYEVGYVDIPERIQEIKKETLKDEEYKACVPAKKMEIIEKAISKLKRKIARIKSLIQSYKPLFTSSKKLVEFLRQKEDSDSSSEEEDESISDDENWQDAR